MDDVPEKENIMVRRQERLLGIGCLLGLASAALIWSLNAAARQLETDFKAEDDIKTLSVRIQVGAGGADLEEPVALDLGLGFPFWLHPVGRESASPPFGAVPQETSAQAKIAAGSSAAFTFNLEGAAGQDELRTTPQLLAGVHVADISRIGFAGAGNSAWILAGYEIQINGKVFASKSNLDATETPAENKKLIDLLDKRIVPLQTELADLQALAEAKLAKPEDLKRLAEVEAALKTLLADKSKLSAQAGIQAKAAQDAARSRLAELKAKITPLFGQWADNRTLVESQLAEDADRAQLTEAQNALTPLLRERAWLEGQLEGRYPWFEDKTFKSPWRTELPLRTAKVTIQTQTHPGADTQNYLYFCAGGHKYLLGSPARPPRIAGLQVFRLDLFAAPLTQGDLRGWALGMLGLPEPYGAVPNRWHPARLLVELDGKIAYDSEENANDRQSMLSIRLIPPAHRGQDGALVINTPNTRETFLWEAGKGQGLDAVTGKASDLPATDDANYPKAEPGLPDVTPPTAEDQAAAPDVPSLFPGEQTPVPDAGLPSDAPPPVTIIIIGDQGQQWPLPPDGWLPDGWLPDGWPPDALPPDWLPWPPDGWPDGGGNTPQPAFPPFQIETVRITDGWQTGGPFTVQWTVSGDESQIDHYEVAMVQIRPSDPQPIGMHFRLPGTFPVGARDATGVPDEIAAITNNDDVFLAPYVVAIPVDPLNTTPHEKIGAARATCPPFTWIGFQAVPGSWFQRFPGGFWQPMATAEPPSPARGVWQTGQVVSYLGLEFEALSTGWNLAARPGPMDTELRVPLFPGPAVAFGGTRHIVFHLGFLGGANANNTVTGTLETTVFQGINTFPYPAVTHTLTTPAGAVDQPMVVFRQTISTSNLPGPPPFASFWATMRFSGGTADPSHAPALFGIRIVPGP